MVLLRSWGVLDIDPFYRRCNGLNWRLRHRVKDFVKFQPEIDLHLAQMTFALRVHLYLSVHKGDVLKLGNQVEVSEEGRLDLRAQRLQIRIRGFGAVRLDARADRQPKRGVELRDAARDGCLELARRV